MALIERESEVAALRVALDECLSGRTRIALVEGAAGCGKSELVDTVTEWAEDAGALVLQAFGSLAEKELPLGVMRQLAHDAPPGSLPEVSAAPDGQPQVRAMREFRSALAKLSTTTPVMLSIDDLHHADDASLRYLQHLVRHSRTTSMLLLLAGPLHHAGQDAAFGTELLRSRNVQRIRLRPLSREGTAGFVTDVPQPAPPAELADELHAISGGNPLLLRALLEEYRSVQPGRGDAGHLLPEPEEIFGQAVLTCLRRSGPHAPELGAVLAVLGDSYTPERAGRLLGQPAFATAQSVASLAASGILDGHRFRHPSAESAVLDRASSTTLAGLHLRTAEFLYAEGESVTEVAGHLLSVAQHGGCLSGTPWAAGILSKAGERLVLDNDATRATTLLELAHELSEDEQQRAAIKTRLAAITWRVDPATAENHLSVPLEVLRSGRLPSERMAPLAALLTGQGRIAEAAEVRARLLSVDRESDLDGFARTGAGVGTGTSVGTGAVRDAVASEPPLPAGEEPVGCDAWPLPETESETETATAERFLRAVVLADATLEPIIRALRVLVHSRRPERAALCCRELIAEAERQGAPTWQALFSSKLAEVLLRLGDLHPAEEYANRALAYLPDRCGSAFAGGPTAVAIRVRTLMGDHATVARLLQQPLSDNLFRSVHGLYYLRARGLYLMATHQLEAALADLREASRLARRWGVDRPAMLPWRTDTAEVLIRLGEPARAERLVEQQLATPDAQRPWVRGISLRLRAETADPRQQLSLLNQAVDELARSGDRVEQARALADLGRALRTLGEPARADLMTRRALILARESGAEAMCAEIAPELGPEDGASGYTVHSSFRSDVDTKLSDSERRVATLAASGYTNREISLRLHITVSTVEQHLTRVYRKLNITRRQDLPFDLQLTVSTTEVA
ncbi:AAA family ATPase [Streptomyces sp. DT171]|uniref:helix-turn-helix transcriptional regulator n=1 Tax=Streptomyces sp. DT171 TaxID=3416524 RepID=UPI003CF86D85